MKGYWIRKDKKFLVTTNNRFPIKIKEHDRMFCIFGSPLDKKPSTDYFNTLIEHFNEENAQLFYNMMMARDISKVFLEEISTSKLKENLKDLSWNLIVQFFKSIYCG